MALHIRNITDETRRRIKMAAASAGVTLEKFVVDAAAEYADAVLSGQPKNTPPNITRIKKV